MLFLVFSKFCSICGEITIPVVQPFVVQETFVDHVDKGEEKSLPLAPPKLKVSWSHSTENVHHFALLASPLTFKGEVGVLGPVSIHDAFFVVVKERKELERQVENCV